jgi:hypothetical protein
MLNFSEIFWLMSILNKTLISLANVDCQRWKPLPSSCEQEQGQKQQRG